MSKPLVQEKLNRRQSLRNLGIGAAGTVAALASAPSRAQTNRLGGSRSANEQVTIRKVRAIATAPQGIRLVVVKVETSEPGLYGLGCATFNQRPLAVVEAVDKYLDPFARDRDVATIEDIWQNAYTSSYWRNGHSRCNWGTVRRGTVKDKAGEPSCLYVYGSHEQRIRRN